jgi:DNA (cytosine-5)-methyltransferase 1
MCCEGGASAGYAAAGFEPEGVDIKARPRYPFRFHKADALDFPLDGFDFIHASPPCQAHTQAQRLQGRTHPELIGPIRERLIAWGGPWVIENVPGAPMRKDLVLCGSQFGLRWKDCVLYRHRWFESNVPLPFFPPMDCLHDAPTISIFGHTVLGASRVAGVTYKHPNKRVHLGVAAGREVMGAPWMSREGLSEAIPPCYSEFIGTHLLNAIRAAA